MDFYIELNPNKKFYQILWITNDVTNKNLTVGVNSILQVLLESSAEQNHGQVLRKLLSVLTERGIEEKSVLQLLLKEAEDNSTNNAGILSECDIVGHTQRESL